MNKRYKANRAGFNLIEIMISLILISILAAAAIPEYKKIVMKTKQSEAKAMLSSIYSAQHIFMLENSSYASTMAELPISPPESTLYTYTLSTEANGQSYTARAEANLDDDDTLDVWTVDQEHIIENTVSDIVE